MASTVAPTAAASPHPLVECFACDFEDEDCGMQVSASTRDPTTESKPWVRASGETPSVQTGPDGAFEGLFYMYTEASIPNNPRVEFSLTGPVFPGGVSGAGFSFAYSMYGSSVGHLHLQVAGLERNSSATLSNWTTVWSRSGNQGAGWNTTTLDLATHHRLPVASFRFVSTSGSSFTGDVAVDSLHFWTNASVCPNYSYPDAVSPGGTSHNDDDDDEAAISEPIPAAAVLVLLVACLVGACCCGGDKTTDAVEADRAAGGDLELQALQRQLHDTHSRMLLSISTYSSHGDTVPNATVCLPSAPGESPIAAVVSDGGRSSMSGTSNINTAASAREQVPTATVAVPVVSAPTAALAVPLPPALAASPTGGGY
uniref:MAM domain-containing protein n=1 Tax=Rhizochromulina marina TaxID=1034831 RepID=A0A7S2SSX9_9STRA